LLLILIICAPVADILRFSSFFFHAPPPSEIYTLSLHDALPIFLQAVHQPAVAQAVLTGRRVDAHDPQAAELALLLLAADVGVLLDRKSTRLNSSHVKISYAVFCLKKKKNIKK